MKKVQKMITRDKSVISGKKNLEPLIKIKKIPVFSGCVESSPKNDLVADMEWAIDKDTGIIQLTKLLPLKTLYLNQHNDSIGKIWDNLYEKFTNFIKIYAKGKKILEIGGAHDKLANHFLNSSIKYSWTIIEPNPQNIKNKKIKLIKGWFNNKFKPNFAYNTVVHSHVLEHTYNPDEFIKTLAKLLELGQRHIFAIPNMLPMLKNNFTNCLNFEHTTFLTEHFTDYLLQKYGFKILEKQYYGNPHSIFYATEKVSKIKDYLPLPENKYKEYKKIFMNFISYHKKIVKQLNAKMGKTKHPTFLFGAHIFSTYLFAFGLRKNKTTSILDNSPLKQGKRLYGTNFIVNSPNILKGKGIVNIILKAGIYNEEIAKQIHSINKNAIIW